MKIIFFVSSLLLLFGQNILAIEDVSSSYLIKDSTSWDGNTFEYAKGKPEITIQKIDISPKNKPVSLAIHCHTSPVAAYVLKGSVEVMKPSGEYKLFKAGDAFIEVMNEWHKGIFTEDTELIVFYAGEKNIPLSFKQDDKSPLSKVCK